MNARSRTTIGAIIAVLAILAILPIGMAGAQTPTPPPPAVPFEAADMPVTDGDLVLETNTPPVGDTFQSGADRLTALQAWDGGWGWPLTPPTDPTHSPLNTLGPIAMGLERAAGHTGDPAHHSALEAAGGYLLTKTNNFSPSDGYLAQALDKSLGTTDYTAHLNTFFYGPLAAGTYNRNGLGTLYDTEGYVALVRANRAGFRDRELGGLGLGHGPGGRHRLWRRRHQ